VHCSRGVRAGCGRSRLRVGPASRALVRRTSAASSALSGASRGARREHRVLLLPVISIYFASGWRQRPGRRCVAAWRALSRLLRSDPSPERQRRRVPSMRMLADPVVAYTFLFSAFIVAIRIVQLDFHLRGRCLSRERLRLNAACSAAASDGRGLFAARRGVAARWPASCATRWSSEHPAADRPIGWLVFRPSFAADSTGPTASGRWRRWVSAGHVDQPVPLITAAVSDTYGPGRPHRLSRSSMPCANFGGHRIGAERLRRSL